MIPLVVPIGLFVVLAVTRSTSRKIWSDVGNELDDATGLAAICVELWIVDDEAQAPATARAKRSPHDFLEVLPRQPSHEREFPRCATCGEIPFVENIQIRVEPPVRCVSGDAPDGLTPRPSRIRRDLFGAPHDHAARDSADPELMPPGVIMRTEHHERIRCQGAKGPADWLRQSFTRCSQQHRNLHVGRLPIRRPLHGSCVFVTVDEEKSRFTDRVPQCRNGRQQNGTIRAVHERELISG